MTPPPFNNMVKFDFGFNICANFYPCGTVLDDVVPLRKMSDDSSTTVLSQDIDDLMLLAENNNSADDLFLFSQAKSMVVRNYMKEVIHREKAATTIQARVRGKIARSTFKSRKNAREPKVVPNKEGSKQEDKRMNDKLRLKSFSKSKNKRDSASPEKLSLSRILFRSGTKGKITRAEF